MTTSWNPTLYSNKHSFVQEYGSSLIDLLDPQPYESILDVGCGTGELTAQLSLKSKQVIGFDSSPDMIKQANKNFPNIDFRVENAENFDLDQLFDGIFSNAALHWVLDYQKAIDCLYRHLIPGGRLVLEMGGKGNIDKIETALRGVLRSMGYLKKADMNVWYFPTIGNYTSALENAGFQVSTALLYDRPTPLKDSESGIVDWITMFGQAFMDGISAMEQLIIAQKVQDILAPELLKSGTWCADYRRLRVVAWK